jgi:hypothetical protein
MFQDSLPTKLPYWDISDGVVITKNGTMETGISYDLPVTSLAGSQRIAQLHKEFMTIFRTIIPEQERVRIYIRTVRPNLSLIDNYRSQAKSARPRVHSNVRTMGDTVESKITEGRLVTYQAYLTFTVSPLTSTSAVRALLRATGKGNFSFTETTFREQYLKAVKLRNQVMAQLITMDLNPRPLTTDQCFELLYHYFNPSFRHSPAGKYHAPTLPIAERVVRAMPWKSEMMLNEQLVSASIPTGERNIRIYDQYLAVVTFDRLPPGETNALLSSKLLSRTCDYWLILEFHHLNIQDTFNKISTKNKWFKRLNKGKAEEDGGTEISADFGASEAHDAGMVMKRTGAHPYLFGMSYVLIHDNEEELSRAVDECKNDLKNNHNMKIVVETVGNMAMFLNLAPFSGERVKAQTLMFDFNGGDFIPWDSPWRGCERAVCLFKNVWDGITPLDPRDPRLPNAHGIILGATGQGKTFLAQSLIDEYMKEKPRVFILDQKLDFADFVQSHGGTTINVSAAHANLPNPFDLPGGEYKPSDEKVEMLSLIIQTIRASGNTKAVTSSSEEGIIMAALSATYTRFTDEVRGEDGGIRKVLTRTPILSDFVRTLTTLNEINGQTLTATERASAERVAADIKLMTGDTQLGKILDKQTTLSVSHDLVYFDLEGMVNSPILRRIGVLMVLQQIVKECMKDKRDIKYIFIDEHWALADIPEANKTILLMVRLLRAYNTGVYIMTQDPTDLTKEGMSTIVSSASYYFLLPCPTVEEQVREIFKLPDSAFNRYVQLKPHSQFLAILNLNDHMEGDVLSLFDNPTRYWLNTSVAAEVVAKHEEMEQCGGDPVLAAERLGQRYPQGLFAQRGAP